MVFQRVHAKGWMLTDAIVYWGYCNSEVTPVSMQEVGRLDFDLSSSFQLDVKKNKCFFRKTEPVYRDQGLLRG